MKRKENLSKKLSDGDIRQPVQKNEDLAELRRSEAKYRGFIENLSVMFYAAEPRPPYAPIYTSPAFAQLGYPLEEWGKSVDLWTRVLHPEDRDWVLEKTETAMRAGAETDYEYRIVARDETVYWVRDRGSFTRDEQGNPVCWQGIILDITAHKYAAEALRDSEERYRNIFENANDLIYVHDLKGNYLSINKATEQIIGYTLEEALKLNMRQVIAPEHLDFSRSKLGEKLAGASGQTVYEIECLTKQKQRVTLEINSNPIYKDGKVVAVQGIARDITERKRTEQILKEREEEYRDLFENANDLIYTHDLKGNYLSINKVTERVLGYSREEASKMNLRQIVVPEHQKRVRRMMADRVAGTRQSTYEVDCIKKDGQRVTLEVSSRTICKDGAEVAVQGIARDITERKRTEAALKDSERKYRELFENAHDLVFTRDLEGNFTSLNRAGEIITGYTREEILRINSREIIAPEYHAAAQRNIAQILAGETLPVYELVIISKSGERILFEINMRLITQEDGTPVGFQGIARDITTRKQTEAALREREEQYRELFENANDFIFTRDLEGKLTSFNRAGEIITGYTREEALQMYNKDLLAPECLKKAQEMNARLLAGEILPAFELVGISKQGERVPFEVSTRLIRQNGKPVGVQGIIRDITERKRNETALQINEAKMKDLFDNAPLGYHELDKEGRVVRVNQTELEMLGYTAEEMLGRFIWEFVVEPMSRDAVLGKLSGKHPLEVHERTFRRKDGSTVPVSSSDKLISDENGQVTGIRTTVQNITERKQVEAALIASEQQYRLMGEGIMHQVWTAQLDGKLDYVNQRTLEYFGDQVGNLLEDSWQNVIHPEDLPGCLENWTHSLLTGEDYTVEFRLRRHDGEYFWHQGRATAGRDAAGNIVRWFGTNTDIDDRKNAEAKLTHFAGHDTLTNLPNRARFMNHLERAVSRAEFNSSFRFAVLFLDIDRFKVINDSLGHSIGDKLLIEIADRLEECLRPSDIVARLGGDEFTVLLTHINDVSDAVRVAERFLQRFAEPFKLASYEVFTSASIGIIVSDEVKRQPEDFLRDADTAMYRAKAAGKSRYEIFDREMHIRNMNLLQMEIDLRRAIEKNEFRVFYQPIVNLNSCEVLEFEALIRWQHPAHGMVPPNDFIGIAEEIGLIVPIGKWILEEACRQTAEWQKRYPKYKNLSISVNLSAKQLLHPNIIAQIEDVLERTAFDPRYLKLEVTESMVMENGEQSLAVINNFHSLGTTVSTDDFGTGYSSLSYLHQFPFDRLKIDRSFVGKMEKDVKSEAIVRTILMLGQNLEIETVAEGIENEHQLLQLRSLGCRLGQGYFFSKPVDAKSVEKILEEGLPVKISTAKEIFNYRNANKPEFIELDEVQ